MVMNPGNGQAIRQFSCLRHHKFLLQRDFVDGLEVDEPVPVAVRLLS